MQNICQKFLGCCSRKDHWTFRASISLEIQSQRLFVSFFVCRTNFLQVDIFYQELSFQHRKQNVAFGFVSLLGEIGGFLGLLLGASTLTFCELMDYLILIAFRKWSSKPNQVKSISVAPVSGWYLVLIGICCLDDCWQILTKNASKL